MTISEKEKFMGIITTQTKFLKSLRPKGKKVLNEHRTIILNQLNSWLYEALLKKTLFYPEFKELRDMCSEEFSWEKLTGVKQLSIFDDIPDYE